LQGAYADVLPPPIDEHAAMARRKQETILMADIASPRLRITK